MKPTIYLYVCVFAETITCCASYAAAVEGENYAHDLCGRSRTVLNSSLKLPEALAGKHLIFGTGLWSDMYLRENPQKEGDYIGLERDILDELAKRGSFTYDQRFVNWSMYETWNSGLADNIFKYDMITASYWQSTSDRMLMGAFTPYNSIHGSYVFFSSTSITQIQKDHDSQWKRWVQFAEPFSGTVWIAILCALVVTGFLYWLMEVRRNEKDFGSAFAEAEFDAVATFTGGGASGAAPMTVPGRILLTSWSWFTLLVVTTYTANLASFLVAKAEAGVVFGSLEEAVEKNKIVCVQDGFPSQGWFEQEYPGYKNLRLVKGNIKVFPEAFAKKECDGALLLRDEFNELTHAPDVHNRCDLQIVGLPLDTQGAGFMVSNDYSVKCTTLVHSVLAFHYTSMAEEGVLKAMKQAALKKQAPACPKKTRKEDKANDGQLDLESMFGIFLIHIACSVVAILVFVWTRASETITKKIAGAKLEKDREAARPQQPIGNGEMHQQVSHILPEDSEAARPQQPIPNGEMHQQLLHILSDNARILSDTTFLKQNVETLREYEASFLKHRSVNRRPINL